MSGYRYKVTFEVLDVHFFQVVYFEKLKDLSSALKSGFWVRKKEDDMLTYAPADAYETTAAEDFAILILPHMIKQIKRVKKG